LKTGPKAPHSTTLIHAEGAAAVAFRRHTLLLLDDCLICVAAVDAASDTLTAHRSPLHRCTAAPLHRCLQRHGISRLPDIEGDKPKRQRFKRYPIGFFRMDIAEVQTAEGKALLSSSQGST
jgi:hypothetical protein